MARAVVVADDRTGALGTGSRFAARGYDARVGDEDAAVTVTDTDSRHASAAVARERTREAVREHPGATVYLKVDSTLRGHVAAATRAAREAAGADIAVAAPAYPEQGRTTAGGTHLLDGTPVTQTTAGTDPDAPVPTADVRERFDADAHLPLDVVAGGADAVRAALDGERGVVTCDATRREHLDAVARGAAALDACYAGSAGLAGHVRLGSDRGVLGVVGSVTPATLDGLDRLSPVNVDAERAVTGDGEAAVAAAAGRAADALGAGTGVITAARTNEDVAGTVEAGRAAGLDERETRARVAAALGRTAARAVEEATAAPAGLFLSGGDTARAVLDALGVTGVSLPGHEAVPGVPVGRAEGGVVDGLPVVTRPGAFGGPDSLADCIAALARYDAG